MNVVKNRLKVSFNFALMFQTEIKHTRYFIKLFYDIGKVNY